MKSPHTNLTAKRERFTFGPAFYTYDEKEKRMISKKREFLNCRIILLQYMIQSDFESVRKSLSTTTEVSILMSVIN
ncbi:hypothetical protein CMK21_08450 [Candidatus Poribacteria bacterium]|nr:hypothetical protein [Candidatus Poribacteria bacterium]